MKNKYNPNYQKQPNRFFPILIKVLAVLIALTLLVLLGIFIFKKSTSNKITLKTIKNYWNQYDYEKVYESSKDFLQKDPYNNSVLQYHGYSCFFLSISQNDTSLAQEYLDESINSLRLALYEADKSSIPQIQYILGKAYFSKNTVSSYYYSDLAIKYLTLAKKNNYNADDIYEYLGLSYASLGMTMESISAFTEALTVRESDFLLLSIAKQYFKASNYDVSEQYLFRIIKESENDEIKLEAKNYLGNIYFEKGNYDKAEQQFNDVIENYSNCADAHYGLGLIYEKQGNLVKARAEWRQAQKIQVNHAGALKKLSIN